MSGVPLFRTMDTGVAGSMSQSPPGTVAAPLPATRGQPQSGPASTSAATAMPIPNPTPGARPPTLPGIRASIHAGTAHTGSFSAAKTVVVPAGSYVTVRFWLGKEFAHAAVSILVATKGTAGPWSAYRQVTSRAVGSDGYAYYTVRVRGWVSLEAALTGPGVVAAEAVSDSVRARGI